MNILCFGDSNTWGVNPLGGRHPRNVRWPGVLQMMLPDDYVVENGINGRTTVFEDPFVPGRRGVNDIDNLLRANDPLDLLIVMLGTNDTKTLFNAEPSLITRGVEIITEHICRFPWEAGTAPEILIVAPPVIGEHLEECPYPAFDAASVRKSRALGAEYQVLARRMGFEYANANEVAHVGSDQVHMEAESHAALARLLAKRIEEIRRERN